VQEHSSRGRRHPHVFVLHDQTGVVQLMDTNQRDQRHSPFIFSAGRDVKGVHLEEQRGHFLQRRRRSPGIDACSKTGSPRKPPRTND
jgi:hypothetical protein